MNIPSGNSPSALLAGIGRKLAAIVAAEDTATRLHADVLATAHQLVRAYSRADLDIVADLESVEVRVNAGYRLIERQVIALIHAQASVATRHHLGPAVTSRRARALSWLLRRFPGRPGHATMVAAIIDAGGYLACADEDAAFDTKPDAIKSRMVKTEAEVSAILTDRIPLPSTIAKRQPGRYLAVIDVDRSGATLRRVFDDLPDERVNSIIARVAS